MDDGDANWHWVCLKICHAIGQAEGTWFEGDWDIPEDEKEEILQAILTDLKLLYPGDY